MEGFEDADYGELEMIRELVTSVCVSEPQLNWLLAWVGADDDNTCHDASAGEVLMWLYYTVNSVRPF